MNRIFLSILAIGAFALMIAGQATAGNSGHHTQSNNQDNMQNPADNSSGVMIIESYSVSASPTNNDMQPLPEDPGVEVAPLNSNSSAPVAVEEDITVQQTSSEE